LRVLGNVLEEFMDVAPETSAKAYIEWGEKREKVVAALEESGLTYFRGGRVLPTGGEADEQTPPTAHEPRVDQAKPANINELLGPIVRGLRRAMHPLANRRKGAQALTFNTEYDVQDLLHALLRPWVADIRPEEFTPSYAGSSTRMDFLLPKYSLVIELKFVRDKAHARKIGDELIVDIAHYHTHPKCDELWCVVFDQDHLITNSEGLKTDLEGERTTNSGKVVVRVFVL